jgi:hypothetical protein
VVALWPYRIYLLDRSNVQAPPFEVELASDKDARHFAALMLDKQAITPCAEAWDGARLDAGRIVPADPDQGNGKPAG